LRNRSLSLSKILFFLKLLIILRLFLVSFKCLILLLLKLFLEGLRMSKRALKHLRIMKLVDNVSPDASFEEVPIHVLVQMVWKILLRRSLRVTTNQRILGRRIAQINLDVGLSDRTDEL
jgi:hypothetical protein